MERSTAAALGALLYQLLAARAPYAGKESASSTELVARVIAGPPEPLSTVAPRAPEELVAISAKAMAREPKRRYPTMLELAAELRAWLEGRVVRAHRTGAWVELSKWVGRNRWAAATIGVGLLALGALVVAQGLSNRKVRAAREAADARAGELRQQDALSRVALAGYALSHFEHLRARQLLDGCPADLRRWEWHYLSNEIDTSDVILRVSDRKVIKAAFTPDGRGIVAGTQDDREGGDNRVTLWDVETGELVREIALRTEGDPAPFLLLRRRAPGRVRACARSASLPHQRLEPRAATLGLDRAVTGSLFRAARPPARGLRQCAGRDLGRRQPCATRQLRRQRERSRRRRLVDGRRSTLYQARSVTR